MTNSDSVRAAINRAQQQHITRLGYELHRLHGELMESDQRLSDLHRQLNSAHQLSQQLQQDLLSIKASRTWRYTVLARSLYSRCLRCRLYLKNIFSYLGLPGKVSSESAATTRRPD